MICCHYDVVVKHILQHMRNKGESHGGAYEEKGESHGGACETRGETKARQ